MATEPRVPFIIRLGFVSEGNHYDEAVQWMIGSSPLQSGTNTSPGLNKNLSGSEDSAATVHMIAVRNICVEHVCLCLVYVKSITPPLSCKARSRPVLPLCGPDNGQTSL